MTEIPEHLLKRSRAAKGEPTKDNPIGIPEHLRKRSAAAKARVRDRKRNTSSPDILPTTDSGNSGSHEGSILQDPRIPAHLLDHVRTAKNATEDSGAPAPADAPPTGVRKIPAHLLERSKLAKASALDEQKPSMNTATAQPEPPSKSSERIPPTSLPKGAIQYSKEREAVWVLIHALSRKSIIGPLVRFALNMRHRLRMRRLQKSFPGFGSPLVRNDSSRFDRRF